MPKELISIHVALVAILAERMTPMRCIIRISFSIVYRQLSLRVAAPLECKDLQVLHAQIAEIHMMLALHMITQSLKRAIRLHITPILFHFNERLINQVQLTNLLRAWMI